jgi:1-pyrroline-5-carboxylate dehydrogenase
VIAAPEIPKVTYTTMSVDQADAFNRAFDGALVKVKSALGFEHPLIIGGKEIRPGVTSEDRSPNDRRIILGRFQQATADQAREAVAAARKVADGWGATPYQERVSILRRAAENFRRDRFEIGALLSIEAGKNRLESIGEVEEAADLIDTYAGQIEEHEGYVIKLHQLSPSEVNHSVLRPYGVFVVIAPFNFPVALTTGMIAGALTGGNAVVYKPSGDTPFTALYVYDMFAQAGLPDGTLNLVTGRGSVVGEALLTDPGVDGIAFIGSKEVGFHILKQSLLNYPRPCVAEMGGKNPVLVMKSADLDKAVVGTARAAFGYSGQKCSAASRAYVHESVYDKFMRGLVEYTRRLPVGDPTTAETFMGPVINEAAYRTFIDASAKARRDGRVVLGGSALVEGEYEHGYYVEPTIVDRLPFDHDFFSEELFVPLLAVAKVGSLDQALALANESELGLTAGIFTEDQREQDEFLRRMQAGVLYVNRKGGATTGAWPGVQSFGGWKGSGSTGKSALGPYYVQQFMREQSQTVVRE